jgi:enhancing lycopene biosynthesis protein 2
MGARVGVLLSGCGAFDGSDLHEAVLTLLALERRSARAVCIAPDRPQLDVVDHLSGQAREEESRQVWEEAGRIARGKLERPSAALAARLEALVVVGGFGAAKNLMLEFARPGVRRRLEPSVLEMLEPLWKQRRPLGSVGLGKLVLSALVGEDLFEAAEGGPADRPASDPERRLYHAPGFLGSGRLPEVAAGIEAMVEAMLAVPVLRVLG